MMSQPERTVQGSTQNTRRTTDYRTSNNTAQSGGSIVFGMPGGPRFQRQEGGQDTIFFGRTQLNGPIVIHDDLTFEADGDVHVSSKEAGSGTQAGTESIKPKKKKRRGGRHHAKRSGTASSAVSSSTVSNPANNEGGESTSSKGPTDDGFTASKALTPDFQVGIDGETADGASQNRGAATLPSIQDDSEAERGGWEKV
ncbi:uncharacterized protein L199_007106 [Kwoniella botswanensis]|uniref:uncharacterized protein n=1 Tax=Kwoniella botswanensis TaxID=1268659 RepID=UPI00315DF358